MKYKAVKLTKWFCINWMVSADLPKNKSYTIPLQLVVAYLHLLHRQSQAYTQSLFVTNPVEEQLTTAALLEYLLI